jgi:dTDP-4-amino-4,6-dideoxy-D-galactose acyltransferase
MLTPTDKGRLQFYSPVSFLRAHQAALGNLELEALERGLATCAIQSTSSDPCVLYRRLDWDSGHFGLPVYRLEFASCIDNVTGNPAESMAESCRALMASLAQRHSRFYVFAEVPSEDLAFVQALGLARFRLIETRLTYHRDDIQALDSPQRFATRLAGDADIANLQDVARRARNTFDRCHADPFFSSREADDYLATYAANSVRGFADMVIVPAPDARPPGAFLTGAFDHRHEAVCGIKIARIPLTAVAPERRGWNIRLNLELMHWFRERGTQMIYTTTQSTNRAAIHVLESLRYTYGRCTHVFALGVRG